MFKIVLVVIVGMIGFNINSAINNQRIVFEACQNSRMGKGISENTCGEMQELYHAEYICKENNSSPSNVCWVENNDKLNLGDN